jgi:hypothetical protein
VRGQAAAQHRDARELADAAGERGVTQQPDREGGEDTVVRRIGRIERLHDRQLPRQRAREHGDEVEAEREHDPRPVDEVESVVDDVPVRSPPPEQEADERKQHEHAGRLHPAAGQELHAATSAGVTPATDS